MKSLKISKRSEAVNRMTDITIAKTITKAQTLQRKLEIKQHERIPPKAPLRCFQESNKTLLFITLNYYLSNIFSVNKAVEVLDKLPSI